MNEAELMERMGILPGEDVECSHCGSWVEVDDAKPDENDGWECYDCHTMLNRAAEVHRRGEA